MERLLATLAHQISHWSFMEECVSEVAGAVRMLNESGVVGGKGKTDGHAFGLGHPAIAGAAVPLKDVAT